MRLLNYLRPRHHHLKSARDDGAQPTIIEERHLAGHAALCQPKLLQEIFHAICPHTLDDSLLTCDESSAAMVDGECMLCDASDLAQCISVNRQWSEIASNLLYHCIRIDPLHYCRPGDAVPPKKRPPFFRRTQDHIPPSKRLQLLCQTVRGNRMLADKVEYLKICYMTRESCIPDLSRIVSVLKNLRYVDLPEAFYSGDSSANFLREELQSCTKLRHMKYTRGAEHHFERLATHLTWRNLETLELSHLTLQSSTILEVLAGLWCLRSLKVIAIDLDDVFFSTQTASRPLTNLALQDIPNLSIDAFSTYLGLSRVKTLSLTNTGIPPADLHRILSSGRLTTFQIIQGIIKPMPLGIVPLLASQSLKTLHYEISSMNASSPRSQQNKAAESYYTYLARSVLSGSLPSLTCLYALSENLLSKVQPDLASLSPYGMMATAEPLVTNAFPPLKLYTKDMKEMEWQLSIIIPPTPNDRRGSVINVGPESLFAENPQSSHLSSIDRDLTTFKNGFGGFFFIAES